MSEYQYYEFLAIDRPLTREEQEELRSLSTRARITAASFTNEYQWGNFRGDPRRMVEQYYDAHLYLTNWGTHQVILRLPKGQLTLRALEPYFFDECVEAWTTKTHLVLDLRSEDEGGDWEEGAEDSLGAIAGVRAELASGDHRALYLAWLSGIGAWQLQDDDETYQEAVEPPVPAGLDRLTAPQRALADFLRVDADLLAVAAQASSPAPVPRKRPGKKELAPLIAALPETEKNDLLLRLAVGDEPQLGAELVRRLRGEPTVATVPGQRSVAELLDAAHARATERRQRADRVRAEARAKKLTALATDEEAIWHEVENHVARKQTARYDTAVALLVQLRDACDHVGRGLQFRQRLAALRDQHRHLPGLLRRLDDRALRG
ncbi:hypothetical protein [Streptomyces sp. CB01881]|uniref:hypothetical protein n=1 Tax=Streptomyces sp. CB01881 TaxID=2078691 RepID=UPI000CDC9858|nr:hypothetical protein [Streptomyces sp. CB01881]AUY50515.1 hypothetical protein C2142_17995 [Streptomyces sp. CB01881]TYC73903.1 hypothetical protein EH183_17975 [Streptomyces sp. CB01881]